MDIYGFLLAAVPPAAALSAVGYATTYVVKIANKVNAHDILLDVSDKRTERIEAKVDKLVDHLITKKAE